MPGMSCFRRDGGDAVRAVVRDKELRGKGGSSVLFSLPSDLSQQNARKEKVGVVLATKTTHPGYRISKRHYFRGSEEA